MLRFLVVTLLPLYVLSQCTTCNQQQSGYIGIYGNSYGSSAQYSSGSQYVCNSCQMNGGQQYSCNSCQYSPNSNQIYRNPVTTTMSPSYTLGQCTCNNCQMVQGAQYSCNSCQQQQQYSSTSNPYATQRFQNPSSGCSSCQQYGSSNQQFYNPSTVSPTLHFNDLTDTNLGYPPGYSSDTSVSPNSGFQSSTISPGLQPLSDQNNYGYSTYGSAQYNNPSTMSPYGSSQYGYSNSYGSAQYSNPSAMSPYGSSQYGYSNSYGSAQYNNPQYSSTMSPYGSSQYGFSSTISPYNQPNDGTYVSGQYLPGVQGHLYDSRVGLTQFNTEVKKR